MMDNREDWENRPRKYGLTQGERELLVQRHFEQAKIRQAEEDLALVKAVRLGAALRRLKGG
jgi:hypothetical protein